MLLPAAAASALFGCAAIALAARGNFDLPFNESPAVGKLTGTHSTVTYAMSTFDEPFRLREGNENPVETADPPVSPPQPVERLDEIPLVCHGGVATIRWYVGDLEPTTAETGITLTITLDGQPLASLIKGGHSGIYDDGPASALAVTRCAKGTHRLWMQIASLQGGWGIPYAGKGSSVNRGFVVNEVW